MAPVPFPDPPQSVEGFRIGGRLRVAGALAVHAGTSKLDLPVQVLLAPASALQGGFEADDFLAGVRRAASVHHEALLPFVTGGREGALVFAVAKSVEGRTLEEALAADGPMPEPKALALAATLAGALAALERGGMRHGDLAPDRIVLAGLNAFVVGPPRLFPASLVPRAERWQAPEEARGGENGVQSDLFVLGLILVQTMTGTQPLAGAADVRRTLRDWRAPDLIAILRRASTETRAVVARLLAPEPANRFASAADAQRALQDAANAQPETAPVGGDIPALRPLPETAKRTPGRLYVEARLGDAMLEIDDDAVYVGADAARNVRTQSDSFAEAAIRIERTPVADVVHAMAGEMSVNGRVVSSQALADGDRIEASGLAARYERATRTALRATGAGATAPPGSSLAAAITGAAIVLTSAALGWGAWRVMGAARESADAKSMAARAEQRLHEEKRLHAPAAPPPATGPVQAERAARDAYEEAARSRRRPAEARANFYSVWQRHPDTAYGLLARLEALEIDRGIRPEPDRALEELLAAAEAPDGVLDDEALSRLRGYVEDHAGTLAGQRAHVALVKSQTVQRGRFDADMAALRAAVARRDWLEARTVVKRVNDYVPPHLKDEVLAEVRKIDAGMGETQKEGRGGGAGGQPRDPASGKVDEAERNRKAEEVLRNARRLMDGGKDVEALEGFLTFLREYRDTPNGAKYDLEARGRITTLSTGPAGIVKLFRGRVEKADKGRWRITYDFENAAQLQDFRDVAAFDQPPRSAWRIEGGAVRAKRGSGALVLDAILGANEVSASVTVNPERPHDIGVMFMDPGEQRRFYLFTLQNTFFKLGKGESAPAFLENAIVLFGPDMWSDTPPGQIGFVRKCGSDDPAVHPLEPTPVKAGKSAGEVWMRFEGGRSIRGSAYGDRKYEFPGVTPGLFVLGSAGFFDDFTVEGSFDTDWVQKRWRAILSGL